MTPMSLLTRLRALGVSLWVDGDRLRCQAPAGVLDADLKAELARCKTELIRILASPGNDEPPLVRLPRNGSLPVSSAQKRLWFLDKFEPGSPVYNIPGAVRITGALNVEALERVFGEIVRRHESLRTIIKSVAGAPTAEIQPASRWTLPIVTAAGATRTEIDADIARLVEEEARKPFTLDTGPLFRTKLVRVADDEHVLLLTVHHIVSDGWSMGVLIKEVVELYAAFSVGKDSPLPELPIQYVDFAAWQNEVFRSRAFEEQIRYWEAKLGGELPVLDLPFDRPRPLQQTFRGHKLESTIDADVVARVRQFARQRGVTLFMVLMAAFKAVLAKYSGQDDIVVGTSIANRRRVEVEPLIGFFTNTLALRTDLSGDPSFSEIVARERDVMLEAESNQDVPFEELVDRVAPERTLSHPPVFQVMLVLQNYPSRTLELGNLELAPLKFQSGTSRFDLTLDVAEDSESGSLVTVAEYNTDLFDPETIERLQMHLAHVLRLGIDAPEARLSEITLPLPDLERQIIERRNATSIEVPDATVTALFESRVDASPDAVALVAGSERLSYGELDARVNRLARHLRRMGVGPEVLVGICVERTAGMVEAMLAVLKAGGAYVPLDPAYPEERVAYMITDAGIGLLVTDAACRNSLPTGTARIVDLDAERDEISKHSAERLAHSARGSNLAYVIYTSGSTGHPKGVQIEHAALTNFLLSMQHQPGMVPDDRCLALTTISFDISKLEIYLPLISGGTVVVASRRDALDPARLAALLRENDVTVMQATPATWRLLVETGWNLAYRAGARFKALSGGEALPPELADKLLLTGAELWNLYGPTETTVWSAVHPVTSPTLPVPIGAPIANTQIHVLDSALRPVPAGVVGELYIGGAGLARGYLGRPELTAQKFVAGIGEDGARLYATGDRGRFRRDGKLECLGRLDHQVKLRGFRIELGEIEASMAQFEGCDQAVAVVREDVPGDKKLVAYWVGSADGAAGESALRRLLESNLPYYMIPSHFVRLATFPLTPNGKIDRKRLPAPSAGESGSAETFVSPRNELEAGIAEIWQAVLDVERVGVNDNFFDLGGNSLLIVQVQDKLRSRLGREVHLVEFFRRTTVAQLADHLRSVDDGRPIGSRIAARIARQKSALAQH